MNKTIIVGGIESKSGVSAKTGKAWTRYNIKDQADHFVGSTFSDTIVGVVKANIGKQVTLEIEERENPDPAQQPFRDIVGAIPGVLASADDARAVAPKLNGTVPADNSGIRAAALDAAVRSGVPAEDILRTADKYVSWITETAQVQHMKFDPDEVAIPF